MTTTTILLDELRRRGFTPLGDGLSDWFDLPIGGSGALSVPRSKVRVELDDNVTIVHVFTGNGALLWDADLSMGTPPNVVTAVIDLAIAYGVTAGADECE